MNNHDPLDEASQDAIRKDNALAEKLAQQTEIDDIKWLMGSKRGRRMVWHILDRANIYASSFNANSMSMAFAEGAKKEALRMQRLAAFYCADQNTLMLKEMGK